MKRFLPLMTHLFPLLVAVVLTVLTLKSLPASGSVIPKQAIFSPLARGTRYSLCSPFEAYSSEEPGSTHWQS